jgi:hypothetical protein
MMTTRSSHGYPVGLFMLVISNTLLILDKMTIACEAENTSAAIPGVTLFIYSLKFSKILLSLT